MKTILSAGQALREILKNDTGVSAITGRIFPIVSDEAELPYISYARTSLDDTAVKNGRPADTADYEVRCYAREYEESVDLAEAVREALDGGGYISAALGLRVRLIQLVGATEDWVGDAYMQSLFFRIKC